MRRTHAGSILACWLLFGFMQSAIGAVERLCFSSVTEANDASEILAPVLTQADKVHREGHCLSLSFGDERAELIDRWIQHRLPRARRDFSSQIHRPELCELEVNKISQRVKKSAEANLRSKSFGALAQQSNDERREQSRITLDSGKSATLVVDQRELEVTCVRRADVYHLKFSQKTRPRPVVPAGVQLPPGSVVVVPPPVDEEGLTSLSTELTLNRGEEISLGEISDKLKGQDKGVEITPAGQLKAQEEEWKTRWLLSVR